MYDDIQFVNALDVLQKDLFLWLNVNFPNATSDTEIKGVMEELGELCHADIKYTDAIRGFDKAKYELKAKDAIGDMVVFLMNYCSYKNIKFSDCIKIACKNVLNRNWQRYPINGITE